MAKEKKRARRARTERRFEPRSTVSAPLVACLGAVGAAALGAGVYAQFIRAASDIGSPLPVGSWLVAGGALITGAAIWLGTSGDSAVRVGDGGLALERSGNLRRIPWHALESLRWDGAKRALVATGKDDAGLALTVVVPGGSLPQAASWLLKEARARVPDVLKLEGELPLAAANEAAGELLPLDPVQVVGLRCAASGKVIAYEPDARVCARCERAFHKENLPERCPCGAAMASPAKVDGGAESDGGREAGAA